MTHSAVSSPLGADTDLDALVEYSLTEGYGYVFIEDMWGERKWVKKNSAAAHLAERVIGLEEYIRTAPSSDPSLGDKR